MRPVIAAALMAAITVLIIMVMGNPFFRGTTQEATTQSGQAINAATANITSP